MDTTQETESIRDLVLKIQAENIVLPEFQRDFVWEVGKTHDLFDSLIKDIFIGSIIYGIPSFEITVRAIDIRPRKGAGSRAKLKLQSFSRRDIELRAAKNTFRLVLDGQQRVTSLYRALLGIDSVWFICKHTHEVPLDFEKASCEQVLHEFAGQEDSDRLSVKISNVFEMMQNSFFEDEVRVKYFQDMKATRDLPEQEAKDAFRRYLTVSRKLQDVLKAEKLLSYYLLNTTTEKFSLFFERSNSKGIQLNFTDILAAKLYEGFNLRKKIEEFQDTFSGYELNREILVRSVAYIVSKGREVDRNYILTSLTSKDFNDHWGEVTTLYKDSLDFLHKNNFIVSQSWMPYDNMLLPVMFFLKSLGGDFSQMSEEQFKIFTAWYWCSIFSERYSASTNEVTVQDAGVLTSVAIGNTELERGYISKFKILIDAADEIPFVNKKGSVLYTGLLNLMNFSAKGLTDWNNSAKLSLTSKLEDHHIFPKDYLANIQHENEDPGETADSVANRTLIPKITNIKISNEAPSVYLKKIITKNPKLRDSLKAHRIPELTEEGLYDEFYKDFLKERSKLMFETIDQYVLKGRDYLASLAPAKPSTATAKPTLAAR